MSHIPINLVYLIALIPFCIIWLVLFIISKRTRKEMVIMSIFVGLISLLTSYYWWTYDWWSPKNITGTRIGIEDFILGFTSGGFIASMYEVFFEKKYQELKANLKKMPSFGFVLLLSFFIVGYLFWKVGITSFWSSTIALLIAVCIIFYFRPDLITNGLWSGFLMVIFSFSFYFTIMLISPIWINQTYIFMHLSGIKFINIPIEDLVFWFLSGAIWGPMYEYWHHEYLKK